MHAETMSLVPGLDDPVSRAVAAERDRAALFARARIGHGIVQCSLWSLCEEGVLVVNDDLSVNETSDP